MDAGGENLPMNDPRIIPCLDLREGRVVKGVQFSGLRDAGDPLERALHYAREGAAELFLLDIAATSAGRPLICNLLREISAATGLALTVGGGINSTAVIKEMLQSGAARVSMGSAVLESPALIEEGTALFGRSAIVVSIDARKADVRQPGEKPRWEVYRGGGRHRTGRDAVEWACEAEQRGAGEILLNSMDADGTLQGYDLALLKAVTGAVSIPVIASGGAGRLEHLWQAFTTGGANAVLAASILHDGRFTIGEIRHYLAEKNSGKEK